MLDIKTIRKETELVKNKLSSRNNEFIQKLEELLFIDENIRKLKIQIDELKSQRNSLSKSVKSKEEAETIKEKVKEINNQINLLEEKSEQYEEEINQIVWYLPNMPSDEVPQGKDESENVEIKKYGQIPIKTRVEDHFIIAERKNIWDQNNTTRFCGSRFSSFVGLGAKLQRALINFMLDEASQNGYTEISTPIIVKSNALKGTGQLPKFEEDLYKLTEDDLYLIPTAEVTLTNFFANDNLLNNEDLPKRLCAYTTCFRREAGAAGRDTRGLIRQHQFDKVELVHICKAEDSEEEHEKLVRNAEKILEKLELPYRRILLCTGDMGFSAKKCYDIEVWFPSQNNYREISSCSNCGDFQARRLNLRFKRDNASKPEFLHTLNGSGLAIGRCWAAIIENYLKEDGDIEIPQVLRKYMNGLEII